jgi:hypothetical protein
LKIIDLSAGNRAIWFDRRYRDAVYVDVRPEVEPDICADATALPAEIGDGYTLVVFDPPHENFGANGNMTKSYGHWTADDVQRIIVGTAKEAHRITAPDALMAFKWNDHSRKLSGILMAMSPWWEPLFGHGARKQQRHSSMTYWVMLRKRDPDQSLVLAAE